MKSRFSYIFIFTSLVLSSCKKYPEDERRFLFKSVKHRLTKPIWVVDKLIIDDVDSTERVYHENYIFNNVAFSFKNSTFKFSRGKYDADAPSQGLIGKKYLTIEPYVFAPVAGWDFEGNSKEEIKLHAGAKGSTFKLNNSRVMKIIRLDQEKLILESIEAIAKFDLNLKPIKF